MSTTRLPNDARSRGWLRPLQSTLNDAHMILTDAIAGDDREWTHDELTLLDRIDAAILHCQSMRTTDALLDHQLSVGDTTHDESQRSPLRAKRID